VSKIKKMMPQELERNWEALCALDLTTDGRIVTSAEWEQKCKQQEQFQAEKRQQEEEHERLQGWERLDFENLNSLIIQYQQTGDQDDFNMAWRRYLNKLTDHYLHKYVIQGLPVLTRHLFLGDHKATELKNALYPVLVKTIRKWTPNTMDRCTMDFAAFYGKAVQFFSGNLIRKFQSKCYKGLSFQSLDFNSEEDINRLLLDDSQLAEHFEYRPGLDSILMDWHIESFTKTCLSEEQAELFRLLVEDQMSITDIAKTFKSARMTIYRRREQIQELWLAYERGTQAD